MKAPQPALTTATVAALAFALLVGRNVVRKDSEMGSMTEAVLPSTQMAANPRVAVPNARDGSELERREEYSQHFSQQRALTQGSKAASTPNDASQNDLTEEELLAAIDQDLEPWERTPVEIGGALGPQKSAVLIAKHRPPPTQKDSVQGSLTEADFFAALDKDLGSVERTPVEIGSPLGPQRSAVLIAKPRPGSMQKVAMPESLIEQDLFAAVDKDIVPVDIGRPLGPQKSAALIAKQRPASMQKIAMPESLTEDDFFAALDEDLVPVERTPVEIGGPLGPQKSPVLAAKHRPASLPKDAMQASLMEEDFFAALDKDLDPVERAPVEIGGPLGLQKSAILLAQHKPAPTQKDAVQDDLMEEDFFAALDQDLGPTERTPVEIGGPFGPQKSAVLIAKSRPASGK